MNEFILQGQPANFSHVTKSLGEYFFERAEELKDAVCQIDARTGKEETYHDVKTRSTKVAIYLRNMGIKPKDVVLLCCRNNLDNFVPALAALYIGAYVSSINPLQSVLETTHLVNVVKPKIVFVEDGYMDLMENSFKDFKEKPIFITIRNHSEKYADMVDIENDISDENNFRPLEINGSETAVILFSSGTTSLPKGICISHYAIINGSIALSRSGNFKPGCLLQLTCLNWIVAWLVTISGIYTGKSRLLVDGIEVEDFFKLVEKYKITYTFPSIPFCYKITSSEKKANEKYDTSSLSTILLGGSPCDESEIRNIREYFPHTNVNLGYGSSEGLGIAYHTYYKNGSSESVKKINSCGTVASEVKLKVVDLDDPSKLLGPNQKGEILIKSPYLMSGYYNSSRTRKHDFDDDGFFKTGDVGYYDEDKHIYVLDRMSKMFKSMALQIWPGIIEKVIMQHPAVAAAVVFGVPHKIDTNHPAACVVLKPGASTVEQEIVDFVAERLSDAYRLKGGVLFVDEIPKTSTDKFQINSIREYFIKNKIQKGV